MESLRCRTIQKLPGNGGYNKAMLATGTVPFKLRGLDLIYFLLQSHLFTVIVLFTASFEVIPTTKPLEI